MLERTTGIEPASSAWEADILPMNYVRACICLASVLPMPAARPLKCHALKRCTFWRETCLASAIALRLVNQRARAANQRARASKLGNKSTRSVFPFKLRFHSFSWNRTIVSQKIFLYNHRPHVNAQMLKNVSLPRSAA